ncbi:MAG: heme lyase CcmF/NrfE family subunit [Acidimicrobiia bacterium]
MISAVGTGGVLLALASSVSLAWFAFRSARGREVDHLYVRVSLFGILLGSIISFGVMEFALIRDDFSTEYVAEHHSRATPLLFSLATAWAALEGSILLWGLVLAGYIYVAGRKVGPEDRLGAGALAVMALVAIFFFGLLVTIANPFRPVSPVPFDGPGPNPLLQNHVLMAVHPPLLYLGYVGFTVPFAFAISALALGERGPSWVNRTRRWTTVAWMFLTLGITAGAWWSYEVLGWGGYWAWDPVENASFMPWLVGTAYIHSAAVQARRGLLGAWSIALILATFAMTILGTFLTRSGVIASVHSFTQSAIGPALLGFLVVTVVGSFALYGLRANRVISPRSLDTLASREGVFLLNNLLLTVFAFTVLTGTLFPILLEAFTGEEVSVGRPFFDRMATPISFTLLLAMGLGPLTPWRAATARVVWPRLRGPLQAGIVAAGLAAVLGVRSPAVFVVVLVAAAIAAEAVLLFTAAVRKREGPALSRGLSTLRSDAGFWGGQLSHVGVAVIALGIVASSALAERATFNLDRGEEASFGGYEIAFVRIFDREEPNRLVTGADLVLSKDGEVVDVLRPTLRRFRNQVQPIETPSVYTSPLGEDIYVTLTSRTETAVALNVQRYPLISLVWIGGAITALGAALAFALRRKPRGAVATLDAPPGPTAEASEPVRA